MVMPFCRTIAALEVPEPQSIVPKSSDTSTAAGLHPLVDYAVSLQRQTVPFAGLSEKVRLALAGMLPQGVAIVKRCAINALQGGGHHP